MNKIYFIEFVTLYRIKNKKNYNCKTKFYSCLIFKKLSKIDVPIIL